MFKINYGLNFRWYFALFPKNRNNFEGKELCKIDNCTIKIPIGIELGLWKKNTT